MDSSRLEAMEAHLDEGGHFGRPIFKELLLEVKKLKNALEEMPAVVLEFKTKKDMDNWNEWKSKYFNKEGELQ